MEEFAIFFLYEGCDPVTLNHYAQIKEFHPNDLVIPVRYHNFGSSLPGTVEVGKGNDFGWPIGHIDGHSDKILYRWFLEQNARIAQRYSFFDAKILAKVSARNFYSGVWDADLAGVNLITPRAQPRRPDWLKTEEFGPFQCAFSTLAGMLWSHDSLAAVAASRELQHVAGLLRAPTLAKKLGFLPRTILGAERTLQSDEEESLVSTEKTWFSPVRHYEATRLRGLALVSGAGSSSTRSVLWRAQTFRVGSPARRNYPLGEAQDNGQSRKNASPNNADLDGAHLSVTPASTNLSPISTFRPRNALRRIPAIILAYADANVLPGLQVMLSSLRRNGNVGRTPVVTLSADRNVLEDPLVRRLSDEARHISISDYDEIVPDVSRLGKSAYVKGFEAFRDYGAEVNLMLDSDLLCLGDLSELLQSTKHNIRAVPDGCDNRLALSAGGGYVEFNTGVLVVGKSVQGDSTAADLIAAAKKGVTISATGDQGVINAWAYRNNMCVDLLPLIYNFYWGAFENGWPRYRFWDAVRPVADSAKIVHFSHTVKPWHTDAPENCSAVRKWRSHYQFSNAPTWRGLFDNVFVINLDDRPDRWEQLCAELPDDWPFPKPQRISAIDGRAVPPPEWWGPKRPNAPAWGCYRSHLRVLEDCLNKGLKSIIILEDDVVFAPEFSSKVADFLRAVPDDWDMLYFGGWHIEAPEPVNEYVLRGKNLLCNHAYAIRGKAMLKAYKHFMSNDWGAPMPFDDRFGQLHSSLNVYTPRQFLVGQGAGWSNISRQVQPEHWWRIAESVNGSNHSSIRLGRTKVTVAIEVCDTFELIPHFLEHYTKLGVDKVLIGVATANNDALSRVEEYAKDALVETRIEYFPMDQYDNHMNHMVRHTLLEKENLHPDDWAIYGDLDEFQEYPAPLREIIRECNKQDIWAIASEWIDRVSRDGSLPPIREITNIGLQYPIGCYLSSRLLHSFCSKIVICRWKCNMSCCGHHQLWEYKPDRWPIGNKSQYPVHHFKWNSGVLRRLARRLKKETNVGDNHSAECQKFLDMIVRTGRIDYSGLAPRECGALTYPEEISVPIS